MKKQLITVVLCLILFMTPQASSMEEREGARERAVDQIHRQHFHHRENVRENTACCHTSCLKLLPCNWSRGAWLRVQCALVYGCIFAMDYLMMEAEKRRCNPLVTCAGFGGSDSVFKDCRSTTPNEVYRSKDQILLNLTDAVLNDTYLDCLYNPKFEYEHLYQSCSELHDIAGNPLHIRGDLSPKYLFWKEYAFRYTSWVIFGIYAISFLF